MPTTKDFLATATPEKWQDVPRGTPTADQSGGDFLATATPENWQDVPRGTPTATMSANAKPQSWLNQTEEDLREGGSRTVVGRLLGHMQGRGDQGYTGIESGVSPGAAAIMGSPELGAVHTAQGAAEIPSHPMKGAWDTLKGVLETATIPSMFIAPEAAEPAAEAAVKGGKAALATAAKSDKLPAAVAPKAALARAGKLFDEVKDAAGEIPVIPTRSSDEMLRAYELSQSGRTLPKAVRQLIERYTKPLKMATGKEAAPPLTYKEARDFYSAITELSADEKRAMTPIMHRQMGKLAGALKDDIGDAADEAGARAKYYAAMKQYATAKKWANRAVAMKKWAAGAAKNVVKAVGLAALGAAGYEGYNILAGK